MGEKNLWCLLIGTGEISTREWRCCPRTQQSLILENFLIQGLRVDISLSPTTLEIDCINQFKQKISVIFCFTGPSCWFKFYKINSL